MNDHICVYCIHAQPSSTAAGKMWCKNLGRTVEKTDGKNCKYFK